MKRWLALMGGLALVSTPGLARSTESNRDAIAAAVRGPDRTEEERARDVYRHPTETLEFIGIAPDMTIVELAPGAGWYTNILAPLVRDQGRYIGVENDPEIFPDYPDYAAGLKAYPQTVAAAPKKFGGDARGTWILKGDIAPAGSVDMVLGIRFLHNWIARGIADEALSKLHRTLKPGGVFAIVQHRAGEDDTRDPVVIAESGYVKQSYTIALMNKHGFELVAQSEINANPKDTRDHPEGVWTLPPTLELGDRDREKYLAIGESDRMTLKFVKPAPAIQP